MEEEIMKVAIMAGVGFAAGAAKAITGFIKNSEKNPFSFVKFVITGVEGGLVGIMVYAMGMDVVSAEGMVAVVGVHELLVNLLKRFKYYDMMPAMK